VLSYLHMQRERITITLEPDLIAAADALVDKSAIRNRSHALEHLIKEGLGLHLLKQAFVFIGDDWSQSQVNDLRLLCTRQGIETLYLCGKQADVRLALSETPYSLVDVPLDFGSGGSVLLQQANIKHPFLLIWLNAALQLPESLIGPYTAHRQLHAVATQLVTGNSQTYQNAGIAVADPTLLARIPAGIVQLEQTVFPELLKTGKLGTYAF